MSIAREHIWNVHVQYATLDEFVQDIDNGVNTGHIGRVLCCANPHSLVQAQRDAEFLHALQQAELLLPDGFGIVLASKINGGNISVRVSGPDIVTGLLTKWNLRNDRSVFFLGSTHDVLQKIQHRLQAEFPNIRNAGVYAPPFADLFTKEQSNAMIDSVNAVSPTALMVGMTAPKQEKWIAEHKHRLNVPIILAVGAAFDFFAGIKKRSSPTMQRFGLEWLPRLVREPKRLWQRNIISTPIFLYNIIKIRCTAKK